MSVKKVKTAHYNLALLTFFVIVSNNQASPLGDKWIKSVCISFRNIQLYPMIRS